MYPYAICCAGFRRYRPNGKPELKLNSSVDIAGERLQDLASRLGGSSWRNVDKYAIVLKEGGCKDVWLNPLDAATRVTVIQELIPGFTTACTTSQVGPGSGKATLPCAAPNTSIVYNTLDIGYLVEFRNF